MPVAGGSLEGPNASRNSGPPPLGPHLQEHPEGEHDLYAEGDGIGSAHRALGQPVEGQHCAGGDEHDYAGVDERLELGAGGGGQPARRVGVTLDRGAQHDQVEDAAADPGRGR